MPPLTPPRRQKNSFKPLQLTALFALAAATLTTARAQAILEANSGNGLIFEFDPSGGWLRTVAWGLPGPTALAFDSSGDLFVANNGNNTISKFDSSGVSLGTFASGLSNPFGLAFDSSGNLFVANAGNGTISEFDSSGGSLGTFASGLSGPFGIAIQGVSLPVSAVPEPSADATMAGAAMLGFAVWRRRYRKSPAAASSAGAS